MGKDTLTLEVGKSETLTKTVNSGSSTKNISWSSDNSDIAKVDNAGKVTAISPGTTTVTITLFNGSNYYTDKCTVIVKISVTGVTLDKTTAIVAKGNTITLTATVAPDNATNKEVTWSSSNTTIASVSNGVVTAKSEGTATITVKTVDGSKTASCVVTVNKKISNRLCVNINGTLKPLYVTKNNMKKYLIAKATNNIVFIDP